MSLAYYWFIWYVAYPMRTMSWEEYVLWDGCHGIMSFPVIRFCVRSDGFQQEASLSVELKVLKCSLHIYLYLYIYLFLFLYSCSYGDILWRDSDGENQIKPYTGKISNSQSIRWPSAASVLPGVDLSWWP